MALFALVLVLLQLGRYSGVQCQQPTSVPGIFTAVRLGNTQSIQCAINSRSEIISLG